jgi:hypothetical protein
VKIPVNRTSDEFCHRGACPVGKNQQFLELVFLQEKGRSPHAHIIIYRHTYGNRMSRVLYEGLQEMFDMSVMRPLPAVFKSELLLTGR